MIAIRILYLLFCGCFVVVSSQSTDEEISIQSPWKDEEYVLQTFERTCGPAQQLMMEMKRSCDMSVQLMIGKCPQSSTDEKQQLVSALTGKCICKSLVIFASRIRRKWKTWTGGASVTVLSMVFVLVSTP